MIETRNKGIQLTILFLAFLELSPFNRILWVFSHSRIFYMDTSPWPLDDLWLGIHDYSTVRIFYACHTYCDTGNPFKRSLSRNCDIHTCCWAFGRGSVSTVFYDLGLSWPGFEISTFRIRSKRATTYYHSVRHSYTGIFVIFGLSSHTPKALYMSHMVYIKTSEVCNVTKNY